MALDLPDTDNLDVGFDTEASGLAVDDGARVSVVSLAWYAEDRIEVRVLPFDQGALDKPDARGATLFDDAPNLGVDEWDELCAWMARQRLICFNAKYDLHIMRAGHRVYGHGVDLSGRVKWDGMVVNPIVWPGERVSLESTLSRLYGEKESEYKRLMHRWLAKHGKRYDLAPWELMEPYARDDAQNHLRLWTEQLRWIESGEVLEPYAVIDREIDLAICLFRMEARGVGFDVERSEHAAGVLEAEIEKLRRKIVAEWKRPVTPDNARWWFYEKLKQEPEIFTEKGNRPSVDKEAMAGLAAKGATLAKEYQQYAQWRRALDMYYLGWVKLAGPDGRLRPNYHQTKAEGVQGKGRGTISGRLSVERVQLQAIPHEYRHTLPEGVPSVRALFKARPGCELWEADISQAEVRVACHVAQVESMRQVLLAGDDVHGATAVRVFGVSRDDERWSMYRTLAKRLTFATIYGAGPATFRTTLHEQAGIDAPLGQCKEWLDEYRSTFPEFGTFSRKCEGEARRRGFVTYVTGRRRWFSEFEKLYQAHKAMNQVIQGNVAEAMKIIKVEVEIEFPGYLLNEVHDSLMLEFPAGEEAQARVRMVADLMMTVLEEHFGGWDAEHPIPWAVDTKLWGA